MKYMRDFWSFSFPHAVPASGGVTVEEIYEQFRARLLDELIQAARLEFPERQSEIETVARSVRGES